jgi:hypothetical protein
METKTLKTLETISFFIALASIISKAWFFTMIFGLIAAALATMIYLREKKL